MKKTILLRLFFLVFLILLTGLISRFISNLDYAGPDTVQAYPYIWVTPYQPVTTYHP